MKRVICSSLTAVLLVGCSDMTAPRFNDLPESVQQKINAEADPGQIARIEKERDAGRIVYHIEFHQKGKEVKLAITENGTVLSDSRNKVINEAAGAALNFGRVSAEKKFSQLPPQVQKAVGASSGTLEIVNVNEVRRAGKRVYEIEFGAPGKNPKMYVMQDGKIIEDQRNLFRH